MKKEEKKIVKDYIENYYETNISNQTVNQFLTIFEFKEFKKSNIIVSNGVIAENFYILLEGIVGSFVVNNEKKSYIRTLYTKGRAFGSLSSLIQKNTVSNANYTCLTDCHVLQANYNDFLNLKENNKELDKLYISLLEETYVRTEKKMDDLCSLNAKERFLKLIKDIPGILNLLPQYQIANYLNITPVQLSRIRKQLLTE